MRRIAVLGSGLKGTQPTKLKTTAICFYRPKGIIGVIMGIFNFAVLRMNF
jgi:hypothetical protein